MNLMRSLVVLTGIAALSCTPARDMASQARTGEPPRYAGGVADTLPVGAIPDVLLRDNDRNKDIRVNIEYPVRPGPHPLIVFSPAFRLTNRDYVGLSSFWAGRGYVVIRTSHADSGVEDSQTPADWRNRVRDVVHTLDSLPELARRYPELDGRIDVAKVAVAGHGAGAQTALLLGGVRTFPGAVSYADPRVQQVVAISPPGPSEWRGLTAESWTSLSVPALYITGSADQGVAEVETPEWRRQAFTLSPAGDKWLVVLPGARYGTFTGRFDGVLQAAARERARTNPVNPNDGMVDRNNQRISRAEIAGMRQQDLFNLARGLSLAFFDAYARQDGEGRKALESAGQRTGVVIEKK